MLIYGIALTPVTLTVKSAAGEVVESVPIGDSRALCGRGGGSFSTQLVTKR